jgi:hypothetical protein
MTFRGEPVLMVAEVETSDGLSIQTRCEVTSAVALGRTLTHVERSDEYVHYRAADYRCVQPASVVVLHRHDRGRRVGHVEYLKWAGGRILAVAEIDGDEAAHWLSRGECYVSPGVHSRACRRSRNPPGQRSGNPAAGSSVLFYSVTAPFCRPGRLLGR